MEPTTLDEPATLKEKLLLFMELTDVHQSLAAQRKRLTDAILAELEQQQADDAPEHICLEHEGKTYLIEIDDTVYNYEPAPDKLILSPVTSVQ